MRLFLVGARSPTGKDLIEILRRRKIKFMAPPEKHFDPDNAKAIAKMVADYGPTQLINLKDFISSNHSALRRAETVADQCHQVNAKLPAALAEISAHLDIPMLHLSTAYVFDGEKRLSYNENDQPNPRGVYGKSSLLGEQAVRQHQAHIILRPGWLFGRSKNGLIKTWIRKAQLDEGILPVSRRRFSPTYTGDLAAAIVAVCQQVDCQANVFGTYHYCGLESRDEVDFAEMTLKFAANFDERILNLMDDIKLEKQKRARLKSATQPCQAKIFDTFGIKQKSWRGHLQEVVKLIHETRKTKALGKKPLGKTASETKT